MIDDPEEDAWKEFERRQKTRFERKPLLSLEDAFEDYLKTPGVRVTSKEEARRVFGAGWVYAIRNQWEKERNN
jgi:hypothetical protein